MAPTATTSGGAHGTPTALDQALSALLVCLQLKGLLDQTLVVLGTELSRTERINDDGRD